MTHDEAYELSICTFASTTNQRNTLSHAMKYNCITQSFVSLFQLTREHMLHTKKNIYLQYGIILSSNIKDVHEYRPLKCHNIDNF